MCCPSNAQCRRILCITEYTTISSLESLSSIIVVDNQHIKEQDLSSYVIWLPFHNESMICNILTSATNDSCLLIHRQLHIG